jgi:hypothetical protein
MFITNGVDGFYSNSIDELYDNLQFLGNNKDAAIKMGKAGRMKACNVFNHDRYLHEWKETIKDVIGKC